MPVALNILAVLLVILATTTRLCLSDATFVCADSMRCPRKDTNNFSTIWEARLREIEMLKKWNRLQIKTGKIQNFPPYWVTRLHLQYCRDPLTGIFLDDPAKPGPDWETHCVWTGDGGMQSCIMAPSRNNSYSFLSSAVFSARIRDFREHIGCPLQYEGRVSHERVSEVHICSDRCHQAGISIMAAFLLMSVGFLGLLLNCVTLEAWVLRRNQRRWLRMREADQNQGVFLGRRGHQIQGVLIVQPSP